MITINGIDYKIKWGLRTMFIFEQITKKAFSIENTMDSYILFYSMLFANNKECTLSFDEFIDAIEENPSLVNEFNNAVTNKTAIEKILDNSESKNVESL